MCNRPTKQKGRPFLGGPLFWRSGQAMLSPPHARRDPEPAVRQHQFHAVCRGERWEIGLHVNASGDLLSPDRTFSTSMPSYSRTHPLGSLSSSMAPAGPMNTNGRGRSEIRTECREDLRNLHATLKARRVRQDRFRGDGPAIWRGDYLSCLMRRCTAHSSASGGT